MADQRHAALSPGRGKLKPPMPELSGHRRRGEADDTARRRLRHDIQHQVATINLLASLLATTDDISSRPRTQQLRRETHWLGELLQAYDKAQGEPATEPWSPGPERIRLDILAREVAVPLNPTGATRVSFATAEAWVHANQLALWRALRNVMENAFRASGPDGCVEVRVAVEGASAVAQIDDDGPGFGAGPAGLASLGLSIARGIMVEHGGGLEVSVSDLGGGRVRLFLPAAPEPDPAKGWIAEGRRASTDM